MPSHGDGRDAEQGSDVGNAEPLEFVQHEDRPPARGEVVECLPYRDLQQVGRLRVPRWLGPDVRRASTLHGRAPPLIASQVHQDPDEPRLLLAECGGRAGRRARDLDEGVLHQIEGVVLVRDETAGQAIQSVGVGTEQRFQLLRQQARLCCATLRLRPHALLNGRARGIVGGPAQG